MLGSIVLVDPAISNERLACLEGPVERSPYASRKAYRRPRSLLVCFVFCLVPPTVQPSRY